LTAWSAIADAFATSDLPIRVDLVDWATTIDAFRSIIQQDRVLAQRPRQG
jgi:type I restriction enzyme S subunit